MDVGGSGNGGSLYLRRNATSFHQPDNLYGTGKRVLLFQNFSFDLSTNLILFFLKYTARNLSYLDMLAMSECGEGKRERMPVLEEGERGLCSLGGYTARYGIILT